ncbi:MAG: hypothetical protein KGR16_01985 [Verrucomicrobia bacterium]|nr:hypothetical protein [Verrucomicrobiota bacterium]
MKGCAEGNWIAGSAALVQGAAQGALVIGAVYVVDQLFATTVATARASSLPPQSLCERAWSQPWMSNSTCFDVSDGSGEDGELRRYVTRIAPMWPGEDYDSIGCRPLEGSMTICSADLKERGAAELDKAGLGLCVTHAAQISRWVICVLRASTSGLFKVADRLFYTQVPPTGLQLANTTDVL